MDMEKDDAPDWKARIATIREMKQQKRPLTCDQVSGLNAALARLQSGADYRTSRMEYGDRLVALLEIMELFGYEFEDSAAAGNALCHFPELYKWVK